MMNICQHGILRRVDLIHFDFIVAFLQILCSLLANVCQTNEKVCWNVILRIAVPLQRNHPERISLQMAPLLCTHWVRLVERSQWNFYLRCCITTSGRAAASNGILVIVVGWKWEKRSHISGLSGNAFSSKQPCDSRLWGSHQLKHSFCINPLTFWIFREGDGWGGGCRGQAHNSWSLAFNFEGDLSLLLQNFLKIFFPLLSF